MTGDEDDMPERIWAGDFDDSGIGHCVAGMQGGLYAEYVRAEAGDRQRQEFTATLRSIRDAVRTIRYADEMDQYDVAAALAKIDAALESLTAGDA